jgi:two-component system, LytTR family, response regulator
MINEPGFITAIIVDDVPMCCMELLDVIIQSSLGIAVVAVCHNGEDGIKKIEQYKPDVVFLDVEMPGMDGFEMIKKIPSIDFEVIFTTSYENHAVDAIKHAAFDFLKKPVQIEALIATINRFKEKRKKHLAANKPEFIGLNSARTMDTLAVPTLEGLIFIGLNDVVRCESDSKYTTLFLNDKKKIISSRTLGDYDDLLQPCGFFRIHKCYLINLKHLKKYFKGSGGQVMMSDGAVLDVSRRKKDDLLKMVSQFASQ